MNMDVTAARILVRILAVMCSFKASSAVCPKPPNIDNGLEMELKDEYGTYSVIEYLCMIGFAIEDDNQMICQENGSWTQAPTCVHVESNKNEWSSFEVITTTTPPVTPSTSTSTTEPPTCGAPDPIENAKLVNDIMNSHPVGSQWLVQCKQGYTTDKGLQSQNITCLSNLTWSSVNCSRIECGFPDINPIGTRLNATSFLYQDEVVYSCKKGYKLVGKSTRTCLANGRWSGKAAECKRICSEPPSKQNGMIDPNDLKEAYIHGDTVSYICHIGHRSADTSSSLHCSDGEWKGGITCVSIEANEPTDSTTIGTTTSEQTLSEMQPTTETTKTTTEFQTPETEQVVQEDPACVRPSDPNVLYQPDRDEYKQGSIVMLSCLSGFSLEIKTTKEEIVCGNYGEWSTEQFSCIKNRCGRPKDIIGGSFVGDNYDLFESVHYSCDEGYEMYGNGEVQCREGGKWGPIPECKQITCSAPKPIEYTQRQSRKLTYSIGERFTYKCKLGYKIKGDDVITCKENGRWTKLPVCQTVECERLSDPPHGSILGNGNFYGDSIHVSCHGGYKLFGNSKLTCDSAGSWGELPFCQDCIKSVTSAEYTASSYWCYWGTCYFASEGSLNGRGWMSYLDSDDPEIFNEYLQIAFDQPQKVAKIVTKGGWYRGREEYYRKFLLAYKSDRNAEYRYYLKNGQPEIFIANDDTETEVEQRFEYGDLTATDVRIYPHTWRNNLYLRAGVFVYC